MTTKLGQYQKALRAIGDQRLSRLTENVPARMQLDDAWEDSITYMLRLASWKFATRVVQMMPDPDITPAFGYSAAFSIPPDLMRLTAIATDPDFRRELQDYDEHDKHWWATWSAPLYVRFVSNDADHGLDLGSWPVDFAEAHAFYLAWQTGLPITKSGQTRDALYADHQRSLGRSKTLDAVGESVKRKPLNSWAQSRMSSGASNAGRGPGDAPWS